MVHVMNAVVMYSIWWRKPADVALPSVIIRHNLFTDPDRPRKPPRTTLGKFDLVTNQVINIPGLFTLVEEMASSGWSLFKADEYVELPSCDVEEHFNVLREARSRDNLFGKSWQMRHRVILLAFAGISGAIYGAIHATGWNASFPTPYEKFLWRVSCCVGSAGFLPILLETMAGFIEKYWIDNACVAIGSFTGLVFWQQGHLGWLSLSLMSDRFLQLHTPLHHGWMDGHICDR
jgi:hypothetical protein